MNPENDRFRDFLGVTRFHRAGYTGKRGLTASGEDFENAGKQEHQYRSWETFKEFAPDREVIHLDWLGEAFNCESVPQIAELKVDTMWTSKSSSTSGVMYDEALESVSAFFTSFMSTGNDGAGGYNAALDAELIYGVGAYLLMAEGGAVVPAAYTSVTDKVDFCAPTMVWAGAAPFSGTSCAAAVLCGMAALVNDFFIAQTGKPLSSRAMYQFFKDHCRDVGAEGKDTKCGWGAPILPDPAEIDVEKYGGKTGMIEVKYMTENPCFGAQRRQITPRYLIIHSTGSPIPSKEDLFRRWNKADAQLSIHAAADGDGVLITLPLNLRGWHVGELGNGETVGLEICEGPRIRYLGGETIDQTKYNPKDPENIAWFERCWENALAGAAYICRETGLPTYCAISHAEAYKMGLASNHGDPEHWFRLFGKTMDGFRAALKERLEDEDMDMKGLVELVKNATDEERTALQAALGNPTYARIDDVPEYWREETRALMAVGAIDGGTPAETNPSDVNMSRDALKAAVICKRYIDGKEV